MEGNLLLEQFSRYKKLELEASPFHFLLDANIELNPHQINAFCAAIQALKTGGIVLADEVGLGKTIEAGLVLKYVLESGAKRVLIALPASLRKQWELELEDKFGLQSVILDRLTVEKESSDWRKRLTDNKTVRIVLTSYDYSSKLMKRFPEVKWDFIIIDEAHNLRNVFHGTKRAKNLYEMSKGIPKILLTATPLQNSLTDLHGLVSFIDQRIFGSEKVFNKRYIEGQDYSDLKRELSPVLYRTLRKDVAKYMNFKKRTCKTVDFTLSQDEIELYQRVNDFLKRELLYSIPTSNRGLIILVIRKLLASSSFALIETFEILKNRLEKLYEGSKSANAQEGFDLFWSYVEDEIDESGFEETEDEDTIVQKQFIQAELDEVNIIIDVAKRIKTNAKVNALKTAIQIAFDYQFEQEIPQKVVIFTESKRTQKYIAAELRKTGFEDEDILLFNGDFDDTMTKEIYKAYRVLSLDETCRELNRKYILPIGYERNNMFLTDWSEEEFAELDFYDMFDLFYQENHTANGEFTFGNAMGTSAVYLISKEKFEPVIKSKFKISSEVLQSKTVYYPCEEVYEYKPRGLEETEYPEYPYPEVIGYVNNDDGTLTLKVQAVFPYRGVSKAYIHEVTVRDTKDGGIQYVGNRIIEPINNPEIRWHVPRLTRTEWEELYGDN